MEWISVKDELPPLVQEVQYSERVLVYCEDQGEIALAYIHWDDAIFDDDGNLDIKCGLSNAFNHGWGKWVFESIGLCGENPTYWMPLPKPPEEKNE